MKQKVEKTSLKFKNFCLSKDDIKAVRKQATVWGEILPKDISDEGFQSKI